MRRWLNFRYFALVTGVIFLSLLLPACSDDSLPGDPNWPAGTPPIRFLSFRSDTTLAEDAVIELRWTADSLASPGEQIVIYVKDADGPTWRAYKIVERSVRSLSVPFIDFTEEKLRFKIGYNRNARCDSTGIIARSIVPFEVLFPRFRTGFLRSLPNQFRWQHSALNAGRKVYIDYARYGEGWGYLASPLVDEGSLTLTELPQSTIGWFRFRFRIALTNQIVYVDSVPQMILRIKNVAAGDEIERGKNFNIDLEFRAPITSENILSLSTDDGATWEPLSSSWFVTQPASSRCYLRYANAYFNAEHIVGPFSIVDNTTPFFQPSVGMHLEYRRVHSEVWGGNTVTGIISRSGYGSRYTLM